MGNFKNGVTPRRVAAAILGEDLHLTAVNLCDQGFTQDLAFTDEEWRKISEAAEKLVASMVERLEQIAGEVSTYDLPHVGK